MCYEKVDEIVESLYHEVWKNFAMLNLTMSQRLNVEKNPIFFKSWVKWGEMLEVVKVYGRENGCF